MLYIIDVKGKKYHWHVGQKNPIEDAIIMDIIAVQADGHELEFIQSKILNSSLKLRVIKYFGDTAKFIAANLTH